MSMDLFAKAENLISHNEDQADFHGPQPPELIATAEQRLGLAFPPSYRAFLSRYGCGDIAGAEFFGLIDDDFESSSAPDAVWLTLNERRESNLPQPLVLIAATGDGGYYAIDTTHVDGSGESPVVICGPDGSGLTPVAPNFGEFAFQSIRDALSNES
ncbi:MAG: SMI1/KNR4 family protein [Gemmataceae bacterium]